MQRPELPPGLTPDQWLAELGAGELAYILSLETDAVMAFYAVEFPEAVAQLKSGMVVHMLYNANGEPMRLFSDYAQAIADAEEHGFTVLMHN
jgi:hypothetical protein